MKDTPFIPLLLSSYERLILIIDKVFIERDVRRLFITSFVNLKVFRGPSLGR